MSKLLRRLLVAFIVFLGVILLLLSIVYIGSNRRLSRHYSIKPALVTVPLTAEATARGEHIAATRGCLDCHGKDLGGKVVMDNGAMGLIYAPNLTKGNGSVTEGYHDLDWIRSIRHGLTPKGRALVLMPSVEYFELTDEDLGSLIAYLKALPAIARPFVPTHLGPVARTLLLAGKFPVAAELINHTAVHQPAITPSVSVAYGRYLAVGCIGCHNPSYSGGKIEVGPPDWPHAANLTPDSTSRLSSWSEENFIAALRTGIRPDGSAINPIMPRNFGLMTDTELKAIYAFLRTLPAKPTGQR